MKTASIDREYEIKGEAAEPNKPVKVFQRNSDGLLIGEYVGYYNYRRRVFTLYPRYNPFAACNGKTVKHEVAEQLVKFGGT